MSEVPTLKEELERKCIETLTEAAHRLEQGALDKRAAYVTAKTLWTLTAGLVDDGISALVARFVDENTVPGWKRYFVSADPTKPPLFLAVVPGQAYALVKVDPADGKRTTLKHVKSEPVLLEQEVAALVARLTAGGYREI